MILELHGITKDVSDPVTIANLKRIGYTEPETVQVDEELPIEGAPLDDTPPTNETAPADDNLEGLNVKELKYIADARGVEYPKNAGVDKMLELLAAAPVDKES